MDRNAELFCRDELRNARNMVLRDAEAFPELLFALERLGALASGERASLSRYRSAILDIAKRSPMAASTLPLFGAYHSTAYALYAIVQVERNQALHQGAYARNLATHVIELSLIVEDGLVNGTDCISELMVRAPICAELWHPISNVRREMLMNSFSFLPIYIDEQMGTFAGWHLLSDLAISRLLRQSVGKERERILLGSVQDAIQYRGLALTNALISNPNDSALQVLARTDGTPALVLDDRGHLVGIVTPFDLL